ncbi:response regulator [Ammoniphilus sp. 3BR4]|uniref:response regulator n=1 Tax=Ammoniphilus sp. 3BR4 TaxID=3158265 RepID=UPI003467EC23
MIDILLVDDHLAVGQGTKMILEKEPDIKVTVLSSGEKALELLTTKVFDVMLFDLNMPVINGLELTRKVMAINSDTTVLIYTGYDIHPHFNYLMDAGVSGFISKSASKEELVTSIRCALNGQALIPIALLQQLRRMDTRITATPGQNQAEEITINEKEQSILQEIARGKSNKEVAQTLFMSQRTVEYYLTRIFNKLNVKSRGEALVEAKRLRLIPEFIQQ